MRTAWFAGLRPRAAIVRAGLLHICAEISCERLAVAAHIPALNGRPAPTTGWGEPMRRGRHDPACKGRRLTLHSTVRTCRGILAPYLAT